MRAHSPGRTGYDQLEPPVDAHSRRKDAHSTPGRLTREIEAPHALSRGDQRRPSSVFRQARIRHQELESHIAVEIKKRPAGAPQRTIAGRKIFILAELQLAVIAQELETVAAEGDEIFISISIKISRGDTYDPPRC